MQWLVAASRDRWFVPGGELPPGGTGLLAAQEGIDPEGYAGCCEALAAFDLREQVGSIQVPTLVVAGAEDVATPATMTTYLAGAIPGAQRVVVPGAAHIANVEQPGLVLAAVQEFLSRP